MHYVMGAFFTVALMALFTVLQWWGRYLMFVGRLCLNPVVLGGFLVVGLSGYAAVYLFTSLDPMETMDAYFLAFLEIVIFLPFKLVLWCLQALTALLEWLGVEPSSAR